MTDSNKAKCVDISKCNKSELIQVLCNATELGLLDAIHGNKHKTPQNIAIQVCSGYTSKFSKIIKQAYRAGYLEGMYASI